MSQNYLRNKATFEKSDFTDVSRIQEDLNGLNLTSDPFSLPSNRMIDDFPRVNQRISLPPDPGYSPQANNFLINGYTSIQQAVSR